MSDMEYLAASEVLKATQEQLIRALKVIEAARDVAQAHAESCYDDCIGYDRGDEAFASLSDLSEALAEYDEVSE